MRDHSPITLDKFNGKWSRGNPFEIPLDHLQDPNNLDSYAQFGFKVRDGIDIYQNVGVPLTNVKRIYNYPTPTGNTLIVLTYDGTVGNVYHAVNPTTLFGPILTINGIEDIAMVPINGRAYISPFK